VAAPAPVAAKAALSSAAKDDSDSEEEAAAAAPSGAGRSVSKKERAKIERKAAEVRRPRCTLSSC